jgi:hypothetical protein
MASNEEIIRKLYEVAEAAPKKFRSLFTEKGYWWDVPAGVRYDGDDVARAADIYSVAFPDMHRELHDLRPASLDPGKAVRDVRIVHEAVAQDDAEEAFAASGARS